ncbi:MAG: type I DNA topoisomerase [Flavobacteriales bacterium]|nr:type I DNA topoisomerase [Flavobacteriales bacterium]MCB9204770.1 type I DNA topoisomerase [Flavobacteriales bacterium]
MKNLVIVESPAKAKTIEGFLGKDFTVKSSFGHIRDLPSKQLSVDVENNYAPDYVIPKDKENVVKELRKLSKSAETVWLASDEDREGEAISWHLQEALGLTAEKTKRIVFHEITKSAILNAVENPRSINVDLVNAQQARRVLDRLVGYELSPVLWKKVKPNLSAGRVQSVAVRLIVEREREIEDFNAVSSFRVLAYFTVNGTEFRAELSKRFDDLKEAKAFLEKCNGADFSVSDLQKKPAKRTPAAPFTTSTLQQEASRKLGFSVSRTMRVAQDLYEQGKITYMRTDSVNLSDLALNTAKEEIGKLYGEEYSKTRKYSSKSKGAQEAHEAIRPTYMSVQKVDGDAAQKRLYDLIWKRTIASQMADAELERTTVTVGVSTSDLNFTAQGEVIKFDGFLKVYLEGTDDENEEQKGMLPDLSVGQQLKATKIEGIERFSLPPARYTEASLVRKLEELGIGRPSTYAPTISTIIARNYVVKESREGVERKYGYLALVDGAISEEVKTEIAGAEKSKLFPTDIGKVVTDFLVENFGEILNYNFTAQVEKEFDEIAEGQKEWTSMIDSFYKPFHETTVDTEKNSKKATGERLLGVDPDSGRNVYARLGRFGPMVQIGEADNEEKPKFSSLRAGQSMDDVTLEEALDLFKLPREIGEFEGEKLVIGVGKYGPYVRHNKSFVSIGDEDPLSITKETAIELIKQKREEAHKMIINEFQDGEEVIQVKIGRYGPYIAKGRNNYRIPKDVEANSLSLEDCKEIIEKQGDRPKRVSKRAKK